MLLDGPSHLVVGRVFKPRLLAFDLLNQVLQHRLGRSAIGRQGHAFLGAVGIAVAAPPFPRFGLDLLTGLGIADDDRLLVQTCH